MRTLMIAAVSVMIFPQLVQAKAPTWAKDCEAAGHSAKQACEGQIGNVKKSDNAQAASAQAVVGSKGVMNKGAEALEKQGKDQNNRLNNAKNACEAEKQKCAQVCDQEEQDRKAKAAGSPQDPNTQAAKSQEGQVEKNKQSACIAPLMALLGNVGGGAGDASSAANQSANTGKSSEGNGAMPLPLPIPLGGDKGGEEETPKNQNPAAPVATNQTDCSVAANAASADCAQQNVDKCQKDPAAEGCAGFVTSYCGSVDDSTTTGDDSLALTKQNAGVGTNFCTQSVAQKFCEKPGRQNCASCRSADWAASASPAELKAAQASCPADDPAYLVASVRAKLNGINPASATTLVSTQSLTGRMNAQSATNTRAPASAAEAFFVPEKSGMTAPASQDVASALAPNVFSIQSTAYRDMCAQRRLLHCGR